VYFFVFVFFLFFVGEVVLYTLLYAAKVALFDLHDCLISFCWDT
jgi:hypothetical protein